MHRLYANIMPFYIRDLSICRFWYPWGGPGPNPPRILRENCIGLAVELLECDRECTFSTLLGNARLFAYQQRETEWSDLTFCQIGGC